MKIQELFEEKADFGKIQRVIYDYVVSKLKAKPEIISYIKDLIKSSDQFWVHEFDNVLEAIEKEHSIYSIMDDIENAAISVSETITDYFSNANNHPPGYKTQKIAQIVDVTEADLKVMLEKMVPGLAKKYADEEHAHKQKQKALRAEEIKSITKERLASIAAFIKKHDANGWKTYFKIVPRALKDERMLKDYFPKFTKSDLEKFKTAEDLKAAYAALGAKEYLLAIADNLYNIDDNFDKSENVEFAGLDIVRRSKSLSNKLFALL
jgi:hypothetical protein